MRLGDEQIELTEYLAPRGRPVPATRAATTAGSSTSRSSCRTWTRPTRGCASTRCEHASPEPQRLPDWNPNAGGIKAFYFKDPDGHPLEVLQFPAGKGDPKWHSASRPPVPRHRPHRDRRRRHRPRAWRFYRDLLGLRVAGESTNYGPEQERLNNVFGARLHITALRAPAGPGIEFLEYLAPRNGRPAAGIQGNDLAHWETTITTRHTRTRPWQVPNAARRALWCRHRSPRCR